MKVVDSAAPERPKRFPEPYTPSPTASSLRLIILNNPSAGCNRLKLVLDAPRNLNPPLPRTPTSSGTRASPLSLLM